MSQDLPEFIGARLAEEELAARAATPGPWRYDPTKHHRAPGTSRFSEAVFTGPPGQDATCIATTGVTDDPQSMTDAAHIALHDPAAVLRLIESDRRILRIHNVWTVVFPEGAHTESERRERRCVGCGFDSLEESQAEDINDCPTLRAVASRWSDHPEYREDWNA